MIEQPFGERLKTFPSRDPDWRAVIMRRGDGLLFYLIERFWHPAVEDEGIELGWQAEYQSGIYASAELAEAEVVRISD